MSSCGGSLIHSHHSLPLKITKDVLFICIITSMPVVGVKAMNLLVILMRMSLCNNANSNRRISQNWTDLIRSSLKWKKSYFRGLRKIQNWAWKVSNEWMEGPFDNELISVHCHYLISFYSNWSVPLTMSELANSDSTTFMSFFFR